MKFLSTSLSLSRSLKKIKHSNRTGHGIIYFNYIKLTYLCHDLYLALEEVPVFTRLLRIEDLIHTEKQNIKNSKKLQGNPVM